MHDDETSVGFRATVRATVHQAILRGLQGLNRVIAGPGMAHYVLRAVLLILLSPIILVREAWGAIRGR